MIERELRIWEFRVPHGLAQTVYSEWDSHNMSDPWHNWHAILNCFSNPWDRKTVRCLSPRLTLHFLSVLERGLESRSWVWNSRFSIDVRTSYAYTLNRKTSPGLLRSPFTSTIPTATTMKIETGYTEGGKLVEEVLHEISVSQILNIKDTHVST